MHKLAEMTELDFDAEVLQSPLPVLVDFYTPHCAPCRTMMPTLSELAQELDGRAKIVKVNASDMPDLANEHKVMAVPTFLVFRSGEVVHRLVGAKSKRQLLDALGKL
jgi:thioredoxin 1